MDGSVEALSPRRTSLSGRRPRRAGPGAVVSSGRLPTMAQPIDDVPTIDPAILDRASRVIRVLGHPLRLRILNVLEGAERNVTQLVIATGVSQAAVSQQLRILRAEGVVDDRREGSRVFYRITEPKVSKILDCIRTCDVPEILAFADDGEFGRRGLRIAQPDADASSFQPAPVR